MGVTKDIQKEWKYNKLLWDRLLQVWVASEIYARGEFECNIQERVNRLKKG